MKHQQSNEPQGYKLDRIIWYSRHQTPGDEEQLAKARLFKQESTVIEGEGYLLEPDKKLSEKEGS